MKVNLSNSIYQQKGSGYGLNVKDGMLINNRLNSQTGIQEAIQLKQSLKRAQKVAALSEGVALGNSISEMKDHENGCGM